MTNPSETRDSELAAKLREKIAAIVDANTVVEHDTNPVVNFGGLLGDLVDEFSAPPREAADTIGRLTTGEALTWPPIIELGKTLAFYTSVIKSGESWSPECAAAYDRANKALQDLYADLYASPREGHVEVPVEVLRNAVLSCSHTITADEIVLRRSDKMDGNALNQLHQRLAAALPHNQGETKP